MPRRTRSDAKKQGHKLKVLDGMAYRKEGRGTRCMHVDSGKEMLSRRNDEVQQDDGFRASREACEERDVHAVNVWSKDL